MGATSALRLSLSSPKTHLITTPLNLCNSPLNHSQFLTFHPTPTQPTISLSKPRFFPPPSPHCLLLSPPLAFSQTLQQPSPSSSKSAASKLDKSGRFCSPRAARELALLIAYAACLEGSDPVRLFDKRVNATRYPGSAFDKGSLLKYNHMSFGGAPVAMETEKEAEQLLLNNEKESLIEEEVLSAPPKLVYNRYVLRLARDILEAMVDRWNANVLIIDKIIPPNWKLESLNRTLPPQ